MDKIPGYPHLPHALSETQAIPSLFSPEMECTLLNPPSTTLDTVASALQSATLAHFACHGTNNRHDPSQNALLLSDRPLTLRKLVGLQRQDNPGYLAYLSACETFDSKTRDLEEECLHLTSAFLGVGRFAHVVGTLWKVWNEVSRRVAVRDYEEFAVKSKSREN